MAEEVNEVAGNLLRVLVGRFERQVPVRSVRLHHGDDLRRVDTQIGVTDALHRLEQLDRQPLGRAPGSVVDVVEAFVPARMPVVDLEDDLVGQVEPCLRVPDGTAGNQQTVGQDRRDFDDGDVEIAVEAEPRLLSRMAEVSVDIRGVTRIDRGPHRRIGLERQPFAHRVRFGEYPVEFRRRRCSRPQFDPEVLTPIVGGPSACGYRPRHCLRVPGTGETAHRHTLAIVDMAGCCLSGDGLRAQFGAGDSRHDSKSIGRQNAPPRLSRRRSRQST